jgi:hypothetical protein
MKTPRTETGAGLLGGSHGRLTETETVVPRCRFQPVEFRLRPNVDMRHLPSGAEALLNALDGLTPRASVTGRAAMRLEPVFQQRSLPLLKGNLVDIRRNAVPQ